MASVDVWCTARLLYLLPYSPDLNPIEKAWSKLKQGLRAIAARTVHALEQAITELLPPSQPRTPAPGSDSASENYTSERML